MPEFRNLLFDRLNQFIVREVTEFALHGAKLISRDEACHGSKIDGWVLLPNVGDHLDAMLLPICADIRQSASLFREPLGRPGPPIFPDLKRPRLSRDIVQNLEWMPILETRPEAVHGGVVDVHPAKIASRGSYRQFSHNFTLPTWYTE